MQKRKEWTKWKNRKRAEEGVFPQGFHPNVSWPQAKKSSACTFKLYPAHVGLLPLKSSYMIPNNSLACGSPETKSFRSPWGDEGIFVSDLAVTSFHRATFIHGAIPSRSYSRPACRWGRISTAGVKRIPTRSSQREWVALFQKADIIFTSGGGGSERVGRDPKVIPKILAGVCSHILNSPFSVLILFPCEFVSPSPTRVFQ